MLLLQTVKFITADVSTDIQLPIKIKKLTGSDPPFGILCQCQCLR
jgi:hypothetical protein